LDFGLYSLLSFIGHGLKALPHKLGFWFHVEHMFHDIPADSLQITRRLGENILVVPQELNEHFLFIIFQTLANDHCVIWDVFAQRNLLGVLHCLWASLPSAEGCS
jgi:hypothetical protein